jgi:dTDP-4-dehydrorhamnose reductase
LKDKLTALILGGDGALGKVLQQGLANTPDLNVLATSRRSDPAAPLYFDALSEDSWTSLPNSPHTVFFCFGETSLQACENDPAGSRAINVDATLQLARQFSGQGARLVYFSTSLVFDGRHPCSKPGSPRAPQGEYARQKVEVEDALLHDASHQASVIRITKFLDSLTPLVQQWAAHLRAGNAIEPFHDRLICPFSRTLLIDTCHALITRNTTGTFHLSGENDITYQQLASWTADTAQAPQSLLNPVSEQSRPIQPPRMFASPACTSLDMTSTTACLNVHPTPLDEVRNFIAQVCRS